MSPATRVHRAPISTALWAALCASAACGGGGAGTEVDATTGGPCQGLAVRATLDDARAVSDRMVATLRAAGQSGTNADVGGETFSVRGFAVDLAGVDPGGEARTWLAALDAVLVADELEVTNAPAWDTADSATLVMMRRRVGATAVTAFARPAATVFLVAEADRTWRVRSLTVWWPVALAGADEIAAVAACTSDVPPGDQGIRATTFEGLVMHGCGIDGSYAYQPGPADTVTWRDPVSWEALDDTGGARGTPSVWRIVRPARLVVDPSNYWPDVGAADCACNDVVGWELTVDVVDGAVVRYRPGINCVVC